MLDTSQKKPSYTGGHAEDTGSATFGGHTFLNSISSLPFFNPRLRRGPSDFNMAHNFVVNYAWFLQNPQRFCGPINWVLGGWQLGGVYCCSLVNPGNPNGYVKTQCLLAPTPANRRGNLQRNSLTAPRLQDFDFSLIKNSRVARISESFNIQFWVEIFNIFNHANFAPPLDHLTVLAPDPADLSRRTLIPVTDAGRIDATSTTSRQIQFGLKIIW